MANFVAAAESLNHSRARPEFFPLPTHAFLTLRTNSIVSPELKFVDGGATWKPVARAIEGYNVLLPEGGYDLLVLADLDRDGVFEATELVGRTDPAARRRG